MKHKKTIHNFTDFLRNPLPFIILHQAIRKIHLNYEEWGFDHVTRSVLRHMYPDPHVPVL